MTPADKTPADKTPADKTPADKTPDDTTSAVQVAILALDDPAGRPLGSGILARERVVLADETLSRQLYDRADLFPSPSDDLKVLFDPEQPGERRPTGPGFAAELVDGEERERIAICEVYRSLGTPRPWVGFGLAADSGLRPGPLPAEALEGLDAAPAPPVEAVLEPPDRIPRRVVPICLLIPKACR